MFLRLKIRKLCVRPSPCPLGRFAVNYYYYNYYYDHGSRNDRTSEISYLCIRFRTNPDRAATGRKSETRQTRVFYNVSRVYDERVYCDFRD